jgi:septal ring factor EnvC (AmiA/AmiB activator)
MAAAMAWQLPAALARSDRTGRADRLQVELRQLNLRVTQVKADRSSLESQVQLEQGGNDRLSDFLSAANDRILDLREWTERLQREIAAVQG